MTIGNQLFVECFDEHEDIGEVNIHNLPALFTIGPYLVEIYIAPNRYVDFLFKKNACNLLEKLELFFEKNSNLLLQIDSFALAIWKQRDIYHCFDPYSRNSEGLKCRNGSACVSMHSTLDSLISTISTNFDDKNMIFYFHALKICKIHRDPANNKVFPRNVTMNDYPIETFKNVKTKKGKRKAVNKLVTADTETLAANYTTDTEKSILEVESDIRSIDITDLQAIPIPASKPIPKMKPLPEEFIADLDSPSLSDTQVKVFHIHIFFRIVVI